MRGGSDSSDSRETAHASPSISITCGIQGATHDGIHATFVQGSDEQNDRIEKSLHSMVDKRDALSSISITCGVQGATGEGIHAKRTVHAHMRNTIILRKECT